MSSPNPTGGGISQAAGDLLKEMQKAQAEMQQVEQRKQSGGPNQGFQQAMEQQQAGNQAQQAAGQASQQAGAAVQSGRVASDGAVNQVVKEQRAQAKLASTKVGATEKAAESKLTTMLEGLINGQDKMTKIMHIALSGRQFSPTELLAMQAGVYRFTQELDLTSKVVEKATGGIKQTLNTQV